MHNRKRKGAVLGLVVVTVLVLLILGIGLLLLIMQLGGGQELQHATDAGNLNVAKQALLRPGTQLLLGDEANHFADLDDPDTGEVNLKTYNRLVAQSFLISANAQALNTDDAREHSQELINVVTGVANRLNTELTASGNFDQHFHNVAQNHAMRMFQAVANPVLHVGDTHETSLMARGKATNVQLRQNQILPGGPDVNAFSVKGPDNRDYLIGYQQLAGTGTNTLWGVPVRPSEPPHLVSLKTFTTDKTRGPIPDFVPPNAFESGGKARDQIASGLQTQSVSSAIVGSLETRFDASIPRGVIIVDNSGSLDGVQINGVYDIWTDKLMSPNYVEVMGGSGNGLIADPSAGSSPTLSDVKNFVQNNLSALQNGDSTAQNALASMLGQAGVDSWGQFSSNPATNAANSNFISFVNNSNVSKCANGSSDHAVPGTQATTSGGEPCNLEKFLTVYNTGSGGSSSNLPVQNLMAVEKFHLDLCQKRAQGSECETITVTAGNTGLKKYSTSDCGLTQVTLGTVNDLFAQTRVANSVRTQMTAFMRQMKPEAEAGEIGGIFGSVVPFGVVSYIYRDPNTKNLVLSAAAPPWPLPDLTQPSQKLPDGTPQTYARADQPFSLDGVTNCDGECGYPHPWDCPLGSQATGQDTTTWTPSSGWRNILGVIKFVNSAAGGGRFCCPC